jgi:ABC-type transport system involved in cytochrome bd biosynthesis fused ATPase/permease subunit
MFFDRLAELANELQKHIGIATVVAALAVFGPAFVPKLSIRARSTRIILLLIGLIILTWGILLSFAKLIKPAIKVQSTALTLILATGAAFLLFYGILWWNQRRTSRRKVSDLTDAVANHIRVYQQKLGTKFYIDEVTIDDESVMLRLTSLVRQLRRGQRIFLVGPLGMGKTSTLLKFAADCSQLRSASGRPLIAMYVDLGLRSAGCRKFAAP